MPAAPAPTAPPRAELRRLFGFRDFRPGQEDVVRHVLEGRDCLAVMPTGSGKSLCYLLPAMLRPRPTLVVSPLIALMKDQVEHMPEALRHSVTSIHSQVGAEEAASRIRALGEGSVRILFVSPERLRQERFARVLASVPFGLLAVDEAHCVATWGHDFRPDYLFLQRVLAGPLREAAVLALTATATVQMVEEIPRALGRPMALVRTPGVRENLRYEVVPLADEEAKKRFTERWIRSAPGESTIIYARARMQCERLARMLQRDDLSAAHYHADMPAAERAAIQERFLDGSLRIIVATTAFGMGIDKPDIRRILLYNYPASVEDYVQQVGRAGRDGRPSTCVLLATRADAANLRRFTRSDLPTLEELRRVWSALAARRRDGTGEVVVSAAELAASAGLDALRKAPTVHCGLLERAGLIARRYDAGPDMRIAMLPPPADAAAAMGTLLERMRDAAAQRADTVISLGESVRCRHEQVASHFGDRVEPPCGHCDVCAPGSDGIRKAVAESPTFPEPPADPAGAILDTVGSLSWPLGVAGLVDMLIGSVSAGRAGRAHAHYGLLGAVPKSAVKRWVLALVDGGHLVPYPEAARDGGTYTALRVGTREGLPVFRPAAARKAGRRGGSGADAARRGAVGADGPPPSPEEASAARALRAWRLEEARRIARPSYIIMEDRTLWAVARARPRSLEELRNVAGMGPKRVEEWGAQILAVMAGPDSACEGTAGAPARQGDRPREGVPGERNGD